jgi:predicted permease
MHSLGRQLRFVLRSLKRSPLFTGVTVLTLALAIGAVTAVFSVVEGVLLQPLPFDQPDRLVGVWHKAEGLGIDRLNQSPALYFTYREESQVFEDTGMWRQEQVTVTGRGEPEQVDAIRVTDGTLPVLGVEPLLGRLFTAEDDSPGAPETAILAHGYWRERFGGDPAVLGRTVEVDGTPHRVIAVMRPELDFLDEDPALYLPFRFDRSEVFFGNFSYLGVARLAPGATLEQANAEVARMIPMAFDKFPPPEGFSRGMLEEARLGPLLSPLRDDVVGDVGRVLWLLLGTVGIVLLVASANVANLLLVRAEGRHQELAVRSALGAGRRRLGAELLLESLVLGLAGGAAGLGLAWAGLRLLVTLAPPGLPRLGEIGIDPTVLLFTLAVSVGAALGFGALPVVRLRPGGLLGALKEGGRGGGAGRRRNLVRNLLAGAQVALALVLIIGSGLMIRSFLALRAVDTGFRDPAGVLTLRVTIPETEAADPEATARMHESILRGLQALPGVSSATLSSAAPMDGWNSSDPVFVEDSPPQADTIPPLRRFYWVSPGWFETLGTPLLAGRDMTWAEVHGRVPVALISETLAREHWPDPAAAIGRRIRPYPETQWREIVGVVGDVRDDGAAAAPPATVYWPMVVDRWFGQEVFTPRSMVYLIRSPRVGTPGLLDAVREVVHRASPRLPLADVRTLEAVVAQSMNRTSFTVVMLLLAAATALVLGAVGIYGVTSTVVAQRRREIGVRMALGAARRDVRRLVLVHGLVLAVAGAAAGLAVATLATRLMAALLFRVDALDPATFAAGGVGVVLLTLAASYLPARRAAAVDPIETLRWQ